MVFQHARTRQLAIRKAEQPPTFAPVSSSGGKNPGKADDAVTAIATVASPIRIRLQTLCSARASMPQADRVTQKKTSASISDNIIG